MPVSYDLSLSHVRSRFFGFAVASALALAVALTSQYTYGLQPCVLCIYQRWPYAIIIALSALGIALAGKGAKTVRTVFALIAATGAVETVIAFYHSGVERHWWTSFLEGCAVPEMTGNIEDVIARIAQTPAARCDEIPWVDPLLGLSMANYNVAFALLLTIAAVHAALRR